MLYIYVGADALIGPMAGLFGEQALRVNRIFTNFTIQVVRRDYTIKFMNSNFSPSNNPLSLSFNLGITRSAMNDKVI